ncbi:hypothetical protein niasHT_013657 [Heterodera trifolii]|uniref:DUF4704 domain-containing protein n=1 Tax=Heterodera trifolii TaxID=157864 RepID=A0ABD2LGM7_9BILA
MVVGFTCPITLNTTKNCYASRDILCVHVIFSLAYIHPTDDQQKQVTELVYELFSVLLFYAMRLEYGGWRVWVDSMAIAHSKKDHRPPVTQKAVFVFVRVHATTDDECVAARTVAPQMAPRVAELCLFVMGQKRNSLFCGRIFGGGNRCQLARLDQRSLRPVFYRLRFPTECERGIHPPLVTALLYLGVSYQSQFKHEAESNLPDTYRKVQMRLYDFLADDLFCVSTNNSLLSPASSIVRRTHTVLTLMQQFLHVQGFSIVASTIANADSRHLTMNLLEGFISVYKSLLNCSIGVPLLKQLIDSVFLPPTLWVRADATVQMRLYDFLADDLFCVSTNNSLLSPASSIVRRTHTVLTLMHTFKQFYWVVRPTTAPNSAQMAMEPMDRLTVVHIRGCILQIVNRLMFNTVSADVSEKEVSRDEEFQCMLNFVNTVQEVPAFDRKKALCVIFKMISSVNELIRFQH